MFTITLFHYGKKFSAIIDTTHNSMNIYLEHKGKECHSIVRDEASVYFNVTTVHV